MLFIHVYVSFVGKDVGETVSPKSSEKVAASRQDVYAGEWRQQVVFGIYTKYSGICHLLYSVDLDHLGLHCHSARAVLSGSVGCASD